MRFKKAIALLSMMAVMGSLAACDSAESSTADTSSAVDSSSSTEDSAPAVTTAPTEASQPEKTTQAPLTPPDAKSITFDTASLYSCQCLADDGAANCDLSIVDYKGDKKMLVKVLDKNEKGEWMVPKLTWNLSELVGLENIDKIGNISMDITFEAQETTKLDDGSEAKIMKWQGGAIAGNLAPEKLKDADGNVTQNTWAQTDWELNDWENECYTLRIETPIPFKKLPVNGFTNDENSTLVFMRWAQTTNVWMYIDNLTFYDKDGKAMDIVYDAAANPAGGEGGSADTTTTAATTTTTAAAE